MSCSPDTARTLGALLGHAAAAWPDRVAVEHGGETVTFGELARRVEAAAGHFFEAGLTGARTAVLLFDNTADCVVAFLAVARTGARLVPAEPGSTAAQLDALAEELGEPGELTVLGRPERLGALDGVRDRVGRLIDTTGVPGASGGSAGAVPAAVPPEPSGDDPFLYQFSSGSTGAPKAAVHSQANLVQGGLIYRRSFGYGPEDTVLTAVPLLHSFGLIAGLVTSLLTGARLVVLGRFAPGLLLRELERTRATVLVATPLVCDLMVRSAGGSGSRLSSVRLCLSSGAALPPEAARRFADRFGVRISQVYGCTEAGIIACQRQETGGVGRPASGVEVRLVDDAGASVAPGSPGLLLVRTPAMFGGYLNRPENTAEVLRDGWYATGDVARLDEDGVLHLIGRKDSFVNVGGKKVNPVEVEQVLLGHPLLREAVVWGEVLPGGSERVRAAVVACGELTVTELVRYCRERLQPHQVPGRVEFVAELPKTSSGKIRRAEVAAAARVPAPKSEQGGTHQ
ncbi:class I adenylate-forming enzyme family protein [Streptomyces megasporus]|uniref:class I adenylate-forming enzyme family protein n=1 Tax=Streptomyces megasporus TaxID=44060 RepID=UPI00068E476B|nr:AMP-binding protein [Streptomyces megasporus]